MASNQAATVTLADWKCQHCTYTVSSVPVDQHSYFQFCPRCGGKQQQQQPKAERVEEPRKLYCGNPACGAPLPSTSSPHCQHCGAGVMHSQLGQSVLLYCGNPHCGALLPSSTAQNCEQCGFSVDYSLKQPIQETSSETTTQRSEIEKASSIQTTQSTEIFPLTVSQGMADSVSNPLLLPSDPLSKPDLSETVSCNVTDEAGIVAHASPDQVHQNEETGEDWDRQATGQGVTHGTSVDKDNQNHQKGCDSVPSGFGSGESTASQEKNLGASPQNDPRRPEADHELLPTKSAYDDNSGQNQSLQDGSPAQSVQPDNSDQNQPLQDGSPAQSVQPDNSGQNQPLQDGSPAQSVQPDNSGQKQSGSPALSAQSNNNSGQKQPLQDGSPAQSVQPDNSGQNQPLQDGSPAQSVQPANSGQKQSGSPALSAQSDNNSGQKQPLQDGSPAQSVQPDNSDQNQPLQDGSPAQSVQPDNSGQKQSGSPALSAQSDNNSGQKQPFQDGSPAQSVQPDNSGQKQSGSPALSAQSDNNSGQKQPFQDGSPAQSVQPDNSDQKQPLQDGSPAQSVQPDNSDQKQPLQDGSPAQSVQPDNSGQKQSGSPALSAQSDNNSGQKQPFQDGSPAQSVQPDNSGQKQSGSPALSAQSDNNSGQKQPFQDGSPAQSVQPDNSDQKQPLQDGSPAQSVQPDNSDQKQPLQDGSPAQSVQPNNSGQNQPLQDGSSAQSVQSDHSGQKQSGSPALSAQSDNNSGQKQSLQRHSPAQSVQPADDNSDHKQRPDNSDQKQPLQGGSPAHVQPDNTGELEDKDDERLKNKRNGDRDSDKDQFYECKSSLNEVGDTSDQRGAKVAVLQPKKERVEEDLLPPLKKEEKKKKKKKDKEKDKDGNSSAPTHHTRSSTNKNSDVDLSGFQPPPERKFTVVFHAIIPVTAWNWNDKSTVGIRFGCSTLGRWRYTAGNFSLRKMNNFIEAECNIEIDLIILQNENKILYKYFISTDSTSQQDESKCYEFLHGAPGSTGAITDRVFYVPNNEIKVDGIFHQYDSIVYPLVTSKTKVERLKEWIGISSSSSSENEVVIPDHQSIQAKALSLYLSECETMLCECKLSYSFDVEEVTKKISKIFHALQESLVYVSGRGVTPWRCLNMPKILANYLVDITQKLFFIKVQGYPEHNGKRMASAIAIICCILNNHINIEFNDMSALLEMLRLMPDIPSGKCMDWEYVNELIPAKFKTFVGECVRIMVNSLCYKQYFSQPEWLYAMPVMHFLCGKSLPFQEVGLSPTQIPWRNELLDLGKVKGLTYEQNGVVDRIFHKLEPLLVVDPHLLYGFVYVCPRNDLEKLVPLISPYISISFFACRIKEIKGKASQAQVKRYSHLISVTADALRKHGMKSDLHSKAIIDASLFLVEMSLLKAPGTSKESIALIQEGMKVYFECVRLNRDLDKELSEKVLQSIHQVYLALDKWANCTISSRFGASTYYRWLFERAEFEIQVWNHIITATVAHEEEQNIWHNDIVSKVMKSRIKDVPVEKRIDLLLALDSVQNCHSVITNVLMNAVLESINYFTPSELEKVFHVSQKKNVGAVLDKMLNEQYPGEHRNITLDDLLSWDKWQAFIKVLGNKAVLTDNEFGLSTKCILLCTGAQSVLEDLYAKIEAGDTTLAELSKIKEKYGHIKKIISESAPDVTGATVLQLLDARFKEQDAFFERTRHLGQISLSVNIPIKGLEQLRAEIESDHNSVPINKLCKLSDGKIIFTFLRSAIPLDEIREQFNIMFNICSTTLFQEIWEKHMKSAKRSKGTELTIKDINSAIWQPAMRECICLLDSLQNRSIKLVDVDNFFRSLNDRKRQLQRLCLGVSKCSSGNVMSKFDWIDDAVRHMEEYWSLLNLSQAASVVMKLKMKLELSGDFSAIEILANEVTATKDNSPLSSINASLVAAGDFLKELIADQHKLKCLEAFANSFKIVDWIRKETPQGVNDLHKFVSVALHTAAGEGDFANDNLSRLKIVGSGYSPLIYDLYQSKPSFEVFKTCCVKVWDALQQTRSLPENLIACNGDVEWYKSVKDTQASVEVTSYGQMNNIFEHGCYRIGIKQAIICKSHHQVISLSLREDREKRLAKKHYNLEELRDLESKLVLITGRNADNRNMVDLFLNTFHSVCRIAELLIQLQQFGNVKYTGWIFQVPCTRDEGIISTLQFYAKTMESELAEWKTAVTHARHVFYELNYYTTVQLLDLRRELSTEKGESDISPQILFLLQSISSQVTSGGVRDVVKNVVASATSPQPVMEEDITHKVSMLQAEDSGSLSEVIIESVAQAETFSDMPKLTDDDITDNERDILEFVTNRLNCSALLVLKAFEYFREKKMDKYDYLHWCGENVERFQFDEDSDESDEESVEEYSNSSDSSSDSEEAVVSKPFNYSSGSHEQGISTEPSTPLNSSFQIVTIESEIPEQVDEYHAVVQELLSAGYNLEESINAVECCETLDASMDYLDQKALDETDRPINYDRQTSHEKCYLEDFKVTWQQNGPPTIYTHSAENKYLNLQQLGTVLQILSQRLHSEVQQQRSFSVLKEGLPNLLVVEPDLILRSVLSLYMDDAYHPLPTPEEVLICSPSTTAEEIELFWMRAIADPGFKRLFCLVHAENLSYHVSDQALRSLSQLSQGKQGYRLVILCSNEEEEKSHFISKLHLFRRHFIPRKELTEYKQYLAFQFTKEIQSLSSQYCSNISASCVDFEQSRVRFVISDRSGMGKSLYIKRMADNLKLSLQRPADAVHVTVPFHGPTVTPDTVLELFQNHFKNPTCCIYHIDISPSVLWQVDTVLFSLLILRGLCDSQGRVWRCHPNQLYAVEVTIPNRENVPECEKKFLPETRTMSLMKLMPSVFCPSPRKALDHLVAEHSSNNLVLMDDQEFRSDPYQRVFQYIKLHTAEQNLDDFTFTSSVEGLPQDCLQLLLRFCGVRDPSWSEIRHFVKFLNLQLKSCEESVFTDSDFVGDVMAGLKGFVVNFMIRMSRDFSTSSLRGEVALEMNEEVEDDDNIEMYQISERKQWEQSPHPYIFFNQDKMSITFVGFTVTEQGNLLNPVNQEVLEEAILTPQLYAGLVHNRVNFQDDYKKWTKPVMIEKISTVMGVEFPHDPDESYVLTVDNIIKILAIQMRFRCGIPVVIMGETGCGKTRLIRYMCDLARQGVEKNNMMILKVHGGTTEEDIRRFIVQAERESVENHRSNLDTVVFFDEANTTDAIGLIKEIMCDRRINGKPVSNDLKFIAACNPYRKHSKEMIKRLESAGLGFFVQASETQQKLGKIPLRQLVYRVLDLPPSMRPLVYDFGQLNTETENDYIRQIVFDHIHAHPQLKSRQQQLSGPIANVLAYSQTYMRDRKDECSFVSLRDVERAMIVFEYLYDMMDVFGPLMDEYAKGEVRIIDNQDDDEDDFEDYESPGEVARALVLSLSVCYHARLKNREEYEIGVAKHFTGPIELFDGPQQFRDEIRWCQEVLLDSMQLGTNIARNAALRENVFMMTICVELRIPLFLVGKPGSSKSLAKAIISESLRGKDSENDLLKNFKEVQIFSYQCSQLSTPESVIEVFDNASKFQAKQDMTSYVAVVVLDEVGLAEDSPNLPLKALHPLLEDGTEGAKKDFTDQIIARQERVSFIGISNWALDPAKMNRGVMVTRADPSMDELVFSAKGICSNDENDPIRKRLEPYFEPFAKAYISICEKQEREFFGLRDFYSLIKMLYYMCQKSQCLPTWPQLEHAIKRNFGGLETDMLNPYEEFERRIQINRNLDLSDVPDELHCIVNPDCSRLGLIKTSLSPQEKTWHGENRYVLFLTENYAALDILQNPKSYLEEGLSISQSGDIQPFILFGSSFPKDKEYTQVCRNINQIKICMETGRTVILLNLENLYESLYDVLNQYYIYHADSKYVDLGLQTHRVKCRVHDNFKLILIAEKDTVYEKFPTPLINRLEKHFVLTSSILKKWQENVLKDFKNWINKFSNTGDSKFKQSDAFVGYQKDTPASVVFQASNLLRCATAAVREGVNVSGGKWERVFLWSELEHGNWDVEEELDPTVWNEAVLNLSKYLLLQTASPDAIVRLGRTDLVDEMKAIKKIYFEQQHHESIEDFLQHHVHDHREYGLLMQVTTHSHLMSQDEIDDVQNAVQIRISSFFLHEFDTELDFTNKVGPMLKNDEHHIQENRLVIIQCDSGHLNGDLIACARYRIYDLRAKDDNSQGAHVLFIIHLPQQVNTSSFVGFQGDPWISSHIDDLRPTSDNAVSASNAIGLSISQLFIGKPCAKPSVARNESEDLQIEDSDSEDLQIEDSDREKLSSTSEEEEKAKGSYDLSGKESWTEDSADLEQNEQEFNEDEDSEDNLWAERVEIKIPRANQPTEIVVEDMEAEELFDENIANEHKQSQSVVIPFPNTSSVEYPPPKLQHFHDEAPSRSPLFKRLYGCIQAAASRLKDSGTKRSTKRVEILVSLIPKEPPLIPDTTQFHGVLIHHISKVLEERDHTWDSEAEWVIKEAMNPKSLQHGGTFRNALSRRVDEVIVPIFSEIIASIDQNYNLDLVDPKTNNISLSQFWLSMFRECGIMQFNYTDMITVREQVPGVGERKAGEDYKCELPFSWLIHEAVDCQLNNAKSSAGEDRLQLHKQLCEAVKASPVGEVLRAVNEQDCEDFYKHYLHDFVRLVHMCKHSKKHEFEIKEYELLASALDELVHGDEYCSKDGNITFIERIAALHIVYERNRSQVLWFGQLVALSPEVMIHLSKDKICDRDEMILHLCAVEQALKNLVPPLDKDNPASTLTPWLNEVRISQNAITSMINLPSQSAIKVESRLQWEVIRVLQIFLEHVLIKNPFEKSVAYLIRLQLKFKNRRNFLEASTLNAIQMHLSLLEKEVKKKKYFKGKELTTFKRDCHNYFIEVVSTLCFGGQSAPEPELIKCLMDVVFNENSDLVTPLIGTKAEKQLKSEKVSVVRSSLLQLLLEHNSEEVKEHLEEYFKKCQEALNGHVDENLCLLCIQCFEDALCKHQTSKSPELALRQNTIEILTQSHRVLKEYQSHRVITIQYLEGIAGLRFCMMEIANLLHADCVIGTTRKSPRLQFQILLVEEVCTDAVINTIDFAGTIENVMGPAIYLLKLLIRQYGFSCLKQVSEQHHWIIPEGLHREDLDQSIDPFVIYNSVLNYSSLREVLNEALFAKQIGKLTEDTQEYDIKEASILLLTMYEVITLSYSNPRWEMDAEVLDSFNQFCQNMKAFSPLMRQMARLLLANQQGGPLAQMTMMPALPSEYKTLGSIVVHTVAVLSSNSTYQVLLPFVNMMSNPAALTNSYLPTMAEDNLQEVKNILGGQFYECPRGHPYFVGECGRPMQELRCNICGARIGGVNHELFRDNTVARNNDTTQTGHALGSAESRTGPPAPERNLSPPAVCIMRALMHSALLWCSCHYQDMVAAELVALVKPSVNINNLPEFFWMHLRKDIEQLSQVTGKSLDEAAIIIHLVLRGILTAPPPSSEVIATVNSLNAKNAREHWEKEFNTHYIQPVLGDLDVQVNRAMDLVANDDQQGHDQLFYLAYEKIKVSEDCMDPHLWSYRQRVSLEHLGQTLLEKKLKIKYPILHEFLQKEHCLRATQYLPDIVRLQRSLYDAFHHRLDRKKAKTTTIGEYLKSIKNENTRNEYNKRISSLKKAWALVGTHLKTHIRLPLEEKYCLAAITNDVLLEYLVPTTTGEGALTVSLVDFLVLTHNEFIEKCSTKAMQEKTRSSWDRYKIPISHIHGCHLLDYEHQIVSVVLSHCCYSLRVGKAHTVQYDLQALEKHILDKFIHGKPRILSDIPHVVYRKDIYTTVTFDAVRRKVSPQVRLEARVQKEILLELRTPDRLRENLDIVDIVIGFLSSGGGKPGKPLGEYIDKVLKMKRRPFSQKAREYCKLQHILSLWEVLSVDLAKLTWLQEQEPFDSVKEKYMRPLTEGDGVDQVAALNKCLKKFDLDRLLGALFEFIETHVKYSPDIELQWSLVDVITQDQFENLGIEGQFSDEFPKTITLDQAVATWKHIVHYQDNV